MPGCLVAFRQRSVLVFTENRTSVIIERYTNAPG